MGRLKEAYFEQINKEMEENYPYQGEQCVIIELEKGKYSIISNDEYHALEVKPHIVASGWYNTLEDILRRTKNL